MLGVNEHPPTPPTPARDTLMLRDATDRHYAGATFDNDLQGSADGTSGYHRVRPGYPLAVIDTLIRLTPHPQVVADIGTGTEKLTVSLADVYRGATLLALDLSTVMR